MKTTDMSGSANQSRAHQLCVLVGLVASAAAVRLLLRDLPNFAPVAGVALFAGYYFRSRWAAIAAPLLTMAATDLIIGGYFLPMMVAVYGSLAAPALLSRWLRTRAEIRGEQRWSGQLARVAGWVACGLGCSLLFFFASNFAVWLFSPFHAFAYPLTIAGLIECYAMALPFFRFTLAGDLLTSCVLFGGYAAVINLRRSPSVAAA